MPFSTVFQLYCGGQCTYSCFPGVLLTSTPHNIISKPLAAFPHNHCRNGGERGMNTVAVTIINPRKQYWLSWRSNQRPPVLKSATCKTMGYSLKALLGIWLLPMTSDCAFSTNNFMAWHAEPELSMKV